MRVSGGDSGSQRTSWQFQGLECAAQELNCDVQRAAGLRTGATFRTSTAACTCWIPLSPSSRTSAQHSSRCHTALLPWTANLPSTALAMITDAAVDSSFPDLQRKMQQVYYICRSVVLNGRPPVTVGRLSTIQI